MMIPRHVEAAVNALLSGCGTTLDELIAEKRKSGQLLSVNEAAARLSCSRVTVWRRISDGKLPVVRLGGMTRIREDDLLELVGGTKNG